MNEEDVMDQWMIELKEKLTPLKFGGPVSYQFDLHTKADADDAIIGYYLRRRFGKYEILIMATFDTVAIGLHMDSGSLLDPEFPLGRQSFFSVLDPGLDDKIINCVQDYVNWIEFRGDNNDV